MKLIAMTRDEAKKFLLAILANLRVATTEIEEAAKAEGISERTLYRAKRELKNIIAKREAADGGWTRHSPRRSRANHYCEAGTASCDTAGRPS